MLSHEVEVYTRIPVTVASGSGCTVWDTDGRAYLDMYGGHAVAVTGHCHPRVVEAVRGQAERLLFYSNAVDLEVRRTLLESLAAMTPEGLDRIFLVSTGAEANEQALAVARRLTGRTRIVTCEGGFHGRSVATLAAAGIERYRRLAVAAGGASLVEATTVVPFDDARALVEAVDHATAAVIVEPVQGLAGARDASREFLEAARAACDAAGAALIFDEVQCGCGRTGAFTAAQAYGVTPDLLTLAKGIAGGVPMGVLVMSAALASRIAPGELGTTFGGGPLACAAAVANLAVLSGEGLPANALAMEAYLRGALAGAKGVERVTGRGLLLGLVLDRPAKPVQQALLEKGILVGSAEAKNVVRLLPPLVLEEKDAARFVAAFGEVTP